MLSRLMMLLTLGGVLWASAVQAEIYRWVDERGKVHFSDQPKEGGAQKLEIEAPDVNAIEVNQPHADEQPEQQRLLDAYREEREAREEERLKAEAAERQRSQNCAYARNKLDQYNNARLYQPLEDGGRRYLDDDERQREIEQMQAAVRHWCRS